MGNLTPGGRFSLAFIALGLTSQLFLGYEMTMAPISDQELGVIAREAVPGQVTTASPSRPEISLWVLLHDSLKKSTTFRRQNGLPSGTTQISARWVRAVGVIRAVSLATRTVSLQHGRIARPAIAAGVTVFPCASPALRSLVVGRDAEFFLDTSSGTPVVMVIYQRMPHPTAPAEEPSPARPRDARAP